MITLMINILGKKNIIFYTLITLTIFIFFLIFSGFSVPAYIITLAGAAGFYLLIYRKQNTLFIYASLVAIFFLIFYLVQIYHLSLWPALVFASIVLYFVFSFFIVKKLEKNYQAFYVFITILVLGEIFTSINFLASAILIKSLIVNVCFYVIIEMIKLNCVNKLKI